MEEVSIERERRLRRRPLLCPKLQMPPRRVRLHPQPLPHLPPPHISQPGAKKSMGVQERI
eukprot:1596093-Rhodomonas_salina.3